MWKLIAEQLESSYKQNRIGDLLYILARTHNVKRAIEIGCFQGYSTIHLAAALKANRGEKLKVYDAWDWYKYNHCQMEDTHNNIEQAGLSDMVELHQAWLEQVPLFPVLELDLVHIDVSNDGDTFKWAARTIWPCLKPSGLLVMEGGSYERDVVKWMVEYEKPRINPLLESGLLEEFGWEVILFEPFPSLTIMRRKNG